MIVGGCCSVVMIDETYQEKWIRKTNRIHRAEFHDEKGKQSGQTQGHLSGY